MPEINFKSVGVKRAITLAQNNSNSETIIYYGVKTPLENGANGEGLFAMHTVLIDQIVDNLKNLICTNHGERLGYFDLGANLKPLLAEKSSRNDFDEEATTRIKTAVTKYMPYVELTTYETLFDPINRDDISHVERVRIRIKFNISVPQVINVTDKILDVWMQVD